MLHDGSEGDDRFALGAMQGQFGSCHPEIGFPIEDEIDRVCPLLQLAQADREAGIAEIALLDCRVVAGAGTDASS